MSATAHYLRGLNPHLPRRVWPIQLGGVVNSLGSGMVFPFALIYLHNVRGFSFAIGGLALAVGAASALVAGLAAGSLVDRVGGRRTLMLGLLLQSLAYSLFPLIRAPWHAFALTAAAGVGFACFWPGQSVLLTRLTPADRRHHTYALQRISMNLGMGLGAGVGGLIASTAHPSTFTVLFLLDAATFLAYVGILIPVREPGIGTRESEGPPEKAGSYPEVLRDRVFLATIGLNVLFVAVGYEVFALLPAFAKNEAGVSERWVGFMWLANTVLIVLAQLPISHALEGVRRMRALALMTVLWAASALIVLGGGLWLRATSAALVFVLATMVFGIGECLQGGTQGALVADLAPERLRGRYFALSSMSWSLGSVLGPAIGGALLGWHPRSVWPFSAAVCCVAGLGCLALERHLPPGAVRTPVTQRPEAEQPESLEVPVDWS
jgi:MFS family permease